MFCASVRAEAQVVSVKPSQPVLPIPAPSVCCIKRFCRAARCNQQDERGRTVTFSFWLLLLCAVILRACSLATATDASSLFSGAQEALVVLLSCCSMFDSVLQNCPQIRPSLHKAWRSGIITNTNTLDLKGGEDALPQLFHLIFHFDAKLPLANLFTNSSMSSYSNQTNNDTWQRSVSVQGYSPVMAQRDPIGKSGSLTSSVILLHRVSTHTLYGSMCNYVSCIMVM